MSSSATVVPPAGPAAVTVRTLALVGNPNVGKTAVFNALTGLRHTTGNYPGVTVERRHGRVRVDGPPVELADLPGAYSLAAHSPDEMLLADVLLDQQAAEAPIDGIVAVLDASNLERNLYFLSQLLELEKPMVVALNMMDIADRRGIRIDTERMAEKLGVPVVPIAARQGRGIDELKRAIAALVNDDVPSVCPRLAFSSQLRDAVGALKDELNASGKLERELPSIEAFRVLVDDSGYAEQRLVKKLGHEFVDRLNACREAARVNGAGLAAEESRARYSWVKEVMDGTVQRPDTRPRTRSERIDNILTHRVFGTLIFAGVMLFVFQAIYAWAVPVMDLIDAGVGAVGATVGEMLPPGMLHSLVIDGVVAGVGSVLIFLPQILLLSLFIALLEDFGYMARAAFLMDKLFSWCGLSGHSFIPMMSSFACAIPGVMSTRTIRSRRDRFTTILVAPLMSCSARLPVYVIMIAAFIPPQPILGNWLGTQAVILFCMYSLGVAVAAPVAWLLKTFVFRGPRSPFLLEMPSYKIPQASTVLDKVYREGREFVVRAGTLIFAVTVIVWALAYFPRPDAIAAQYDEQREVIAAEIQDETARREALDEVDRVERGDYLRASILGRSGKFIEPVFAPLGWDWRIATATVASFPAREIIVATLGTLFNLGDDVDETSTRLIETLQNAKRPDGSPVFNIAVAFSIMVFFALCAQCGATLAVIKRETGQWRWPVFTFAYMTLLAYVGALVTYQGASLLGFGA